MGSRHRQHSRLTLVHFIKRWLMVVLMTSVLLLGYPGKTVSAGTIFQVNTTQDLVDSNLGNGTCETVAGNCSLRAAIMEANHSSGTHSIILPAGFTYAITLVGPGNDPDYGDIDITSPIIIQGGGEATTIIDGNGLGRVLDVATSSQVIIKNITIRGGLAQASGDTEGGGGLLAHSYSRVTLENVTLVDNHTQNGTPGLDGGGILNHGTMTLTNVTVRGNSAADGGGIASTGILTVNDSHLIENQASMEGGGLYTTGTVTLKGVQLSRNQASKGGGIAIGDQATVTISSSTLSENQASGNGGGLSVSAAASLLGLENLTIHANQAGNDGGGLYSEYASANIQNITLTANTAKYGGGLYRTANLHLYNSILAENQATEGGLSSANCAGTGTIYSTGYNLEDGAGCDFYIPSSDGSQDMHSINPILGPLQYNGGPVQTRALLPGSPAIDSGDVPAPSEDARGVPRVKPPGYDLGAYEKIQEQLPVNCQVSIKDFEAPIQSPMVIAPGQRETSSLFVSGLGNSLWDLDLTTQIKNPDHRQLQITLISPQGKQVTLWGGAIQNPDPYANVFSGTLWDNHALWPISLTWLDRDRVVSPTVPELSLGNFVGSSPNGVWNLVIRNNSMTASASLEGWSLHGVACLFPMKASWSQFKSLSQLSIPEQGELTSQINVSSLTDNIVEVHLTTHIRHTRNNDLIIRLMSPTGQQTLMAYRDGGETRPNVFDGITWDDHASTPVSQIDFDNILPPSNLAPRSALSIFNGQSPKGIWTLEIVDTQVGAMGDLESWELQIKTTNGEIDRGIGVFLPLISNPTQ